MKTANTFVVLVAFGLIMTSGVVQAADGTWNADTNGNWGDVGKWTNSVVADGADFTATLGNVITADRTITNDSARTIGNITALDTTHNYTISGANTLTLGRTSGMPTINVSTSGRTLTIGSVIAGANGLAKTGAGNLMLDGSNTFTGNITSTGGTLSLAKNNACGDITINGGTLASGGTSVGPGTLGAPGGTITFTGTSTFNPQRTNPGAYNKNVAVSSGTTTFAMSTQFYHENFSGVLSGSGTIVKNDSNGVLTFSNASNTFTGAIRLDSGTGGIVVNSLADSANTIRFNGNTGAFSLGAGTASPLLFNNRQIVLSASGSIANNNASVANTITINTDLQVATVGSKTFALGGSNSGNNTFAGSITNGLLGGTNVVVSLVKADGGIWVLSNTANSYSGSTTISGGTLQVANLANGSANSSIGASSSSAVRLILSGGTLRYTGAAVDTDRLFSLQSSSAIDASGTGTLAFSNTGAMGFNNGTAAKTLTLTGTGSGSLAAVIGDNTNATSLAKSGIGTWTLSGTNTFIGATTLSGGGKLILDYNTNDSSKLSDTAALVVGTAGGGTLILSGGSHTEILGPTNTLNNGTGLWISRTSGGSTLQLNTISRPNGQAAISFSADAIASTDNSNVNGILGGWATVGTNWAVNSGGADGAIVGLTSYETNFPTATGDPTKNYQLTGSQTQTGNTTGNSLRLVNGANSDILALGTRELTPGDLHRAGILYVGGFDNNYTITGSAPGVIKSITGNNTLSINVFTGTLTVNALLNSGTSATLKYGVGTLVIGGNNTWQGPLYVLDGTVRLTHNNAAGTTAGGITVQNGAALELANSVTIGNEALSLVGTGISNGGALRNVAGNTSTYGGTNTIGTGGARMNSDSGGSLTLANRIVTALFNDVTIGGSGNTTISGVISGAGSLIKDGSGTLTLSGTSANTLSGDTMVNSGTLVISSMAANAIANAATLMVASDAKLELESGVNETVGVLYLGGQPASPGTWGSSQSAADNKDSIYFSGPGMITVSRLGSGTPYKAQGPAGTVLIVN